MRSRDVIRKRDVIRMHDAGSEKERRDMRTCFLWILTGCLTIMALWDIRYHKLPAFFFYLLTALRISFFILSGESIFLFLRRILFSAFLSTCFLVLICLYEILRKRPGIGGGDLKLLFFLGLFLTEDGNLTLWFLTFTFGLIAGLFLAFKKKSLGTFVFPLVPSVFAAFLMMSLWYVK